MAHLRTLKVNFISNLIQRIVKLIRGLLTLSYTLELSEQQIQKRIDSLGIFPVKNKRRLLTVIASDPKIALSNTDDRLGIELDLKVQIRPIISITGHVMMQAAVDYDATSGEFRLDDPRVSDLQIKGLPGEYANVVREILEAIAVGVLSGITIYQFQSDDKYQRMAKRLLKKVAVEDDRLKIKVGLL